MSDETQGLPEDARRSEGDGYFTEKSIKTDEDGRFTVGYASFETFADARRFVELKQRQNTLRDSAVWLQRFVDRTQAALDSALGDLASVTEELSETQVRDGYDPEDTEHELLVTSLAAALRLSERSVAKELSAACAHAEYFPKAAALWRAGTMHVQHVRVFDHVSESLATDLLPVFEELLLDQLYAADGRLRTPAQLRRVANRIKRQLQSSPTREQVAKAAEDRGIWTEQQECGMTHLIIKTTPVLAEAGYDRLRQIFQLRERGDVRTMSQFMSDAAMALLVTGATSDNDRVVNADRNGIVVDESWLLSPDNPDFGDFATATGAGATGAGVGQTGLAGRTDLDIGIGIGVGVIAKVSITMPATLLATGKTAGGAPHAELPNGVMIDDETALRLAAGAASWTRIFTHPVTGVAVTADTYVPTASLRKLINARDQNCRFPGCTRPAQRGEQDHTIDWQYGGKTTPGNLACLCKHHHALKHKLGPNHGWRVRQIQPGHLEWFGPGGEVHSVPPDPVPTWMPPPHPAAVPSRNPGRMRTTGLFEDSITMPPEQVPKARNPRDRHPFLDRKTYREHEPEEPDDGPHGEFDLLPDEYGEADRPPF